MNCSISWRPSGVVSCPRATCLPSRLMVSVSVASSNALRKVASRSSRMSIRNVILGKCRGAFGIEPARPVLDRIGAVERQRLAGSQLHALQRFG